MREFRLFEVVAVFFAAISIASVAQAQAQLPYPSSRLIDENGIDLGKGLFFLNFEEASIGSGASQLSLRRVGLGEIPSQWDQYKLTQTFNFQQQTAIAKVQLPGLIQYNFTAPLGGEFEPELEYGEAFDATATGFEYIAPDGTKIVFDFQPGNSNLCHQAFDGCVTFPSRIIEPRGNVITFTHQLWTNSTNNSVKWRISSISNSYGYSIDFAYQTGGTGGVGNPPPSWFDRTSASFRKGGVTQSTVSYAYPVVGTVAITDPADAIWTVTATSIKRPTDVTPSFVVTGSPKVTSVARDGVTTTYSYTTSPTYTTTKTNPLGQSTVYTFNAAKNIPTSIKDALNRTTTFQYDSQGRLIRVTQPEGNYVEYTLDARGNSTTTTVVAKTGPGPANIITGATFDATCTNRMTCNKPNTTTDARGNVTNYTYDPTHGGVLTVTAPAPTLGAVQPQMRYGYTQQGGVYSLTGTSACAIGSAPSCIGSADETKTSMVFDTGGNMTSNSAGNGIGTLTATSTMTYDATGNLLTVDGPLAGADDTTRYRYDAARRLIGVIGPNPDGAGALKHRATRNSYRTDGQISKVERGTVNSQSDPDWATFIPIETVDVGYDSNSRRITQKLSGSSSAAAMSQQSYDAVGRVDCVATRMNPAIYGSLPASACSLGTQSSFGPDRIIKNLYDNASQLIQQQVAVGTADAANEATYTYTNNGKLQTLKDAENNLTTYVYDGHDRLSQTQYPMPTV